mgnify:CR=1 FL=1
MKSNRLSPRPKNAEQVECPNCKMMTAKTLKYNHSHNCPATKFKNEPPTQEHPTQEQPKQEEHQVLRDVWQKDQAES